MSTCLKGRVTPLSTRNTAPPLISIQHVRAQSFAHRQAPTLCQVTCTALDRVPTHPFVMLLMWVMLGSIVVHSPKLWRCSRAAAQVRSGGVEDSGRSGHDRCKAAARVPSGEGGRVVYDWPRRRCRQAPCGREAISRRPHEIRKSIPTHPVGGTYAVHDSMISRWGCSCPA
jgi:hypothetical protein